MLAEKSAHTTPMLNFQFDLIICDMSVFVFGCVQIWLRTLNECKYSYVHCAYERSGSIAHQCHHTSANFRNYWPRLCSHIANSRQSPHKAARLQPTTHSHFQRLNWVVCDGRRLHVINHLSTTNSVPFTTFTATIVCCLMMMIFHLFAKFELQLFNIWSVCACVCEWCFFSRSASWIFILNTQFYETLLFCEHKSTMKWSS